MRTIQLSYIALTEVRVNRYDQAAATCNSPASVATRDRVDSYTRIVGDFSEDQYSQSPDKRSQ